MDQMPKLAELLTNLGISRFEYHVERAPSHEQLIGILNEASLYGWQPSSYAVWPHESMGTATHFVLLMRDKMDFAQRVIGLLNIFDDDRPPFTPDTDAQVTEALKDPELRAQVESYLKEIGWR